MQQQYTDEQIETFFEDVNTGYFGHNINTMPDDSPLKQLFALWLDMKNEK